MPDRIVFLGTGGVGYMLVEQFLATGGIYVQLDGQRILVDPGSGSLLRAKQNDLDLKKLGAVLVSHRHPDHCGDVNTILEAMCGDRGGEGIFIVEESCLEGDTRVVDSFHENLPERTIEVSAGESHDLNGIDISTTRSVHYVETVGFVLDGSKKIGYTSDGPYFEGQEDHFQGCDYLILNIMMPRGEETEKHMTVDDAVKLVKRAKPDVAVITHFGFTFMRAGFEEQRKWVEDETGTETIRARDGMEIELGDGGDLERFV